MVSMQLAAALLTLSGMGDTVLLDFQATWCGPCRSMESTTGELIAAGYPVRKVDVDRERDLAASFHVDSIPCFVLVVQGREVDRTVGATTLSTLKGMFAKARVRPRDPSAAPPGTFITRAQSPDPPLRRILPRLSANASSGASRDSTAPAAQDPFSAANTKTNEPSIDTAVLLETSVRLTVEDPTGLSHGSGTLIDSREGRVLVLTCGHIFRDSDGKGKITVDLFTPTPQKLAGQLVSYDLKRDIGLVVIRPPTPVTVARVAEPGFRVALGDKVTTVGCNNGGQPTAVGSQVIGVDKFSGPHNVEVAGQPVQGRSGGGLFASDGTVIGVCNAADPADNQGLYASAETIRGQLDHSGLSVVYQPQKPAGAELALAPVAHSHAAATMPSRMPAADSDDGWGTPAGDRRSASAGATPSAGGSDAEKRLATAAAQGAEVICVVRSPDGRGKSEVIVLDRVSAAFLEQLAAERRAQETQHLTSLDERRTATR